MVDVKELLHEERHAAEAPGHYEQEEAEEGEDGEENPRKNPSNSFDV